MRSGCRWKLPPRSEGACSGCGTCRREAGVQSSWGRGSSLVARWHAPERGGRATARGSRRLWGAEPVSPLARIKMSHPEQQEHGPCVEKRWPFPEGPGVRQPLPSMVISSPCGEMPWEPMPGPCWAHLSVYADVAQRVSWRTRQEPRSPANPGKACRALPKPTLPSPAPMLSCADPSPRRGAEAAAPPQAAPACTAGKKMIL